MRNGILLIHGIQRTEEDRPDAPALDRIVEATREAAPSVVIVAVALALALLPFAVRGNVAGMEILRPLALAVIGGLVTSMLVTLIILPALYARFVTPRLVAGARTGGGAE